MLVGRSEHEEAIFLYAAAAAAAAADGDADVVVVVVEQRRQRAETDGGQGENFPPNMSQSCPDSRVLLLLFDRVFVRRTDGRAGWCIRTE